MKWMLAGLAGAFLILSVQAHNRDRSSNTVPRSEPRQAALDWSEWTRRIDGPVGGAQVGSRDDASSLAEPGSDPADAIDVVDAHWMALTMWGEARGDGEDGMRAVGHVIQNRSRMNGRYGDYVTDAVTQAWQFSCWNPGDPNRDAMLNIDLLSERTRDYRLWIAAKRIAAEILSRHSVDPTKGAIFYHRIDAQPKWSRGMLPVMRIGSHLFFLSAGQNSSRIQGSAVTGARHA